MSTICAPAYVNIFMVQFEKQHIYPYIKNKLILYLRIINDIFTIWKGTNTLQRTIYRKPTDQQPVSMHIQTIKVT